MPRLNVYLPDDVYELASRWRGNSNLSEICARAIKDELEAAEGHRSAPTVLASLRPKTEMEIALAETYQLAEAIIAPGQAEIQDSRNIVAEAAAQYLDRNVTDGSMLALAGGRQIWCVVQHLRPRRVQTTITALGIHQADPKLLHVHPNTLATLVWLLYSPRSQAYLVGSTVANNPWLQQLPSRSYPSYFVFSSCSPFDEKSSFAELVGTNMSNFLKQRRVFGDFAYTFFDDEGKEIDISTSSDQFRLGSKTLRELSKRDDSRIVLVAGGSDKIETMRIVMRGRLCNTLITDAVTAEGLLE